MLDVPAGGPGAHAGVQKGDRITAIAGERLSNARGYLEAVRGLRRDTIDMYPAYDGSLLRYLVGTSPKALKAGLRRTLARIDVEPMRLSRATDHNVYVMKIDVAARLGISKISDFARYWQTAGP